jgi:NADH dehydrogenase (ubiquinone) 1 beta subcomplex subunit 10
MKQKHRMVWERRHGPVGSGMKDASEASKQAEE